LRALRPTGAGLCGNQIYVAFFVLNRRVALLDGVAMSVPHRLTEPALVDFHAGRCRSTP